MKRISIIFLTLISMGVYWNTLPNQFVAGDRQFILRNPQIGNFDTVTNAFTADYWGKLGGESFIYYRPITIFSHFIDFTLYRLNPRGHHFSNMVFHAIVTLMVFNLFLYLCAARSLIPLIGASLFAVHPIHTHSVSYVMGRTDILAALFFLGGLILLVRATDHPTQRFRTFKIMGACLCYLVALLCKEMAVTLPLIFILYWFCWPLDRRSWKDTRFLVPCLSLCCTIIFYLILRWLAVGLMPSEGVISSWYSLWQRGFLVVITCGFYLQKLLFPLKLCYYSNLVVPGTWQDVVQSSFFWIALVWIISFALSLKHAPRLSFSLGWIGITLLPVLNIILIPTLAKENFLYIPSIGFCLFVSQIISTGLKDLQGTNKGYQVLAFTIITFLFFSYSGITIKRNTDYKCPITFLESTLENMTPVHSRFREDGRFFEGVKNFYLTYKNLGLLYQGEGQWDKSAWAFEKALQFTPLYFSPYYAATIKASLGEVYTKMGKLDEAATILLEARATAVNPERIDNLLKIISTKLTEEKSPFLKRGIAK